MRFTSRKMQKILPLLARAATVGNVLIFNSTFASDDGAAPTSGGSNHHAQAAQAVTANQIERDRLLAQQLPDQRAQEVPVARRNDDGGQGFRGLNDETAEAKERRRKAEEAAPPKSGAERPNPKLVKNAQILGLKAKSLDQLTWAEVNKAYKKLAIEYHPDRLAGKKEEEIKRGQEVFISVRSAYEYFNELFDIASDDGAAPTSGGSNHHAQAAQAVTANQIERDRLLAQQLRDQRAQEVPVARRNDDGGQGFRGLNDETAEAKERRRKAEEAAPPKSGAERPNPKLVKNAQILGLEATSLDQLTWAEVNKAYKKLAIEYHPDRLAGKKEEEIKRGQEVFISVQSAYEYFNELYNNGQLKKE